jgi:hypothetical protein
LNSWLNLFLAGSIVTKCCLLLCFSNIILPTVSTASPIYCLYTKANKNTQWGCCHILFWITVMVSTWFWSLSSCLFIFD